MTATRSRNRNGSAPQAPEPTPEPTPEPEPQTVDIAAAVASEEIDKGARVYVDVPGIGRIPTPDGTLATVQREKRADGSLGEYLLAEVRKPKQSGQPDSVQRYSLARVQALKTALESAGVTILR